MQVESAKMKIEKQGPFKPMVIYIYLVVYLSV
jgi:hypothetical protein